MMELVVIGSTEFLPGFALAGVRKTVLATKHDVLDKIKEHQDAGIIILDDNLTTDLTFAQHEQLEASVKPVILPLGKQATQHDRLRKSIISTLGVDLLK
jgi:V/A-type H+/Na+-transporting ATPase subunit F